MIVLKVLSAKTTKVVKADKDDMKVLQKTLSASNYVPRSGGGFNTVYTALDVTKYTFPTTLLGKFKGVKGLKVQGASNLITKFDPSRISKRLVELGAEYVPDPWQLSALIQMFRKPFGILDHSMNAGKTYTNYCYTLLRRTQGARCLIVTPQVTLATQMRDDFLKHAKKLTPEAMNLLNGEYTVSTLYDGNKVVDSDIIIGNSDTLVNMIDTHPDFFASVDYVIFDECHSMFGKDHYKQDSNYLNILKALPNLKGKYGCTGSIHEDKIMQLKLEEQLGTIIDTVTAKELDDADKSATPIYYSHVIEMSQKYTDFFKANLTKYENMVKKGEVASFTDVEDFADVIGKHVTVRNIHTNKYKAFGDKKKLRNIERRVENSDDKKIKRTKFKVLKHTEAVNFGYCKQFWGKMDIYRRTVVDNVLNHPKNENQLIFVDNLKDLFELEEIFKKEGRKVLTLHGGIKADDRPAICEEVENSDGVILIANYQVMAVGVSIKKLHRLHFYSSCKESLRFMQSFGRIIRRHPDIPLVYIHDWSVRLWVPKTIRGDEMNKQIRMQYKKIDYLYKHRNKRLNTLKKRLGYDYQQIVHKVVPS